MTSSVGELIQEKVLFFSKFLRSPGQIGSITPSSKFLARTMVSSVPWDEVKCVAELGAGTGAITRYIQAAAIGGTRVLLFEKEPVLYRELRFEYAEYGCYRDACRLQYVMGQEKLDHLDCVISGLPFFNFPQTMRDHLLDEIIASLKEGGLFVAFQYSRQMKKQLSGRFDIEEMKFVPLNVPPAFVYVCRKRGTH